MNLLLRITADIALYVLVILTPWWYPAIAILAAIIYFPAFYEAFFWSFMIDMLYGAPAGGALRHIPLFFMCGTFVFFFAVQALKTRLRYSW